MKVPIPGLSEATGEVGVPLLPDGKYLFEANELIIEPRSNGTSIQLKLTILDKVGDEDADDVLGRNYTEFFFILPEGHEWRHIGLNQFKNCLKAFGVKVSKDDTFDPNHIVTKKAYGRVRTEKGKPYTDKTGKLVNPTPRNKVVEWFPVEEEPSEITSPARRRRR